MQAKRVDRLSWIVVCGCIGALSGCAGSHESGRPGAMAGDEPEQPVKTGEGATLSSQERDGVEARELMPSIGEVERQTVPESEVGRRDRAMREAVEGPATARGRAADNSAQNERDRTGSTVTPLALESGNDTPDLELTAEIRRALVDEDGLSFDAKNIKIISEGGEVTLRGPVESAAERRAWRRSRGKPCPRA